MRRSTRLHARPSLCRSNLASRFRVPALPSSLWPRSARPHVRRATRQRPGVPVRCRPHLPRSGPRPFPCSRRLAPPRSSPPVPLLHRMPASCVLAPVLAAPPGGHSAAFTGHAAECAPSPPPPVMSIQRGSRGRCMIATACPDAVSLRRWRLVTIADSYTLIPEDQPTALAAHVSSCRWFGFGFTYPAADRERAASPRCANICSYGTSTLAACCRA